MENPYWSSEGQVHPIDPEEIRVLCFDLCNIFVASRGYADSFDYLELEEERETQVSDLRTYALHLKYAFPRASHLLLRIALLVRLFDDQMKLSEHRESYLRFIEPDDGNYGGVLHPEDPTRPFNLRGQCNKILHAASIRPLFERWDRSHTEESITLGLDQDIWYLNGEVELEGSEKGQSWDAVLHIEPFVELVLERVSFSPSSTR